MMEIALSFSGYLNDRTSRYFLNGDLLHGPCSTTVKPVAVIDALLMFACHLTHESETALSLIHI